MSSCLDDRNFKLYHFLLRNFNQVFCHRLWLCLVFIGINKASYSSFKHTAGLQRETANHLYYSLMHTQCAYQSLETPLTTKHLFLFLKKVKTIYTKNQISIGDNTGKKGEARGKFLGTLLQKDRQHRQLQTLLPLFIKYRVIWTWVNRSPPTTVLSLPLQTVQEGVETSQLLQLVNVSTVRDRECGKHFRLACFADCSIPVCFAKQQEQTSL